ncbi:MAG: restriction endonuclease [Bacteroidales bacterium]
MQLTDKQFELLLCEFCRQDLPLDFNVEHDIKDVGEESGNKRQIDTKITGKVGISDLLICGEAKDWSDKVGSGEIDAIVGKYFSGEIRANKVILFSNSGYYEPAITRAKKIGIELLEPYEINKPISKIPFISAVGYLNQIQVKIAHKRPQENLFSGNFDDYIIIKGDERLTFNQYVKNNVVQKLKRYDKVNSIIDLDIPQLTFEESNVSYELKQKKDFLFNGNFYITTNIKWDYFVENLEAGILRHLNTDEIKLINLQGSILETARKVLLSPTKINYEKKEDLMNDIINKHEFYKFFLCVTDPDRNKINPINPKFDIIH